MDALPLEDPANRVVTALVDTLSRFPAVERVILFGSRASGAQRPFSDIDLAVSGVADDRDWTFIRQIAEEARTLLKIDLIRLETVDEAVRKSVLHEGIVLYDRFAARESGL
ncbi:MAG: nucleotidyltransferase domain-containing protein [Vampirovibrionales bacterium]|nr:nucleotidyltransferase domain-containing protein [Vampirovibrionales bacterium]